MSRLRVGSSRSPASKKNLTRPAILSTMNPDYSRSLGCRTRRYLHEGYITPCCALDRRRSPSVDLSAIVSEVPVSSGTCAEAGASCVLDESTMVGPGAIEYTTVPTTNYFSLEVMMFR